MLQEKQLLFSTQGGQGSGWLPARQGQPASAQTFHLLPTALHLPTRLSISYLPQFVTLPANKQDGTGMGWAWNWARREPSLPGLWALLLCSMPAQLDSWRLG